MQKSEWYKQHAIDKCGKDKTDELEKMIKNKASDRKQYSKYKEVLGKEAPKSSTDFGELKYNKINEYKKLKEDFNIVNSYKVDFGKVTAKKILELDKLAFEAKISNQISKYKKTR